MADVSVSANVEESVRDEFDDALDCGPGGSRSRSRQIEHAMILYTHMAPLLEEGGFDLESPRPLRTAAVQAILDYLRDA